MLSKQLQFVKVFIMLTTVYETRFSCGNVLKSESIFYINCFTSKNLKFPEQIKSQLSQVESKARLLDKAQ